MHEKSKRMRKLEIDMADLLEMFVRMDEIDAFFDVKTGKIDYVVRMDLSHEEEEALERLYTSDDHVTIPRMHDEYEWMTEFAESVTDERARERLLDALDGKGAFRRFKDILIRVDLRDAWFTYREQRLLGIALEWLGELEIEPVYKLRS